MPLVFLTMLSLGATVAEPHLAITVNCLLTLLVVFYYGIRHKDRCAFWNVVINVIPATNKAVAATSKYS